MKLPKRAASLACSSPMDIELSLTIRTSSWFPPSPCTKDSDVLSTPGGALATNESEGVELNCAGEHPVRITEAKSIAFESRFIFLIISPDQETPRTYPPKGALKPP